jgi:hydrogenase expression/formation protein HypE
MARKLILKVIDLESGKLENDVLKNSIIDKIKLKNKEIKIGSKVGEDCAVIELGDHSIILTTDPITGSVNDVGKLSINITSNDIASAGYRTKGVLLTILVPEGTAVEEIERIFDDALKQAEVLGIDIIGGHTEITAAVNRVVVSATDISYGKGNDYVTTSGAKLGDRIVISKSPGLEGTGIIASDKRDELKSVLSEEELSEGISLLDFTSVVEEGVIGRLEGASSMHDATEGGLLGALWEVCEASSLGCRIFMDKINILDVTKKISDHYGIDPLKLISSGVMIFTISPDKVDNLLNSLKKINVPSYDIGEIIEGDIKYLNISGKDCEIEPPERDELYKVVF